MVAAAYPRRARGAPSRLPVLRLDVVVVLLLLFFLVGLFVPSFIGSSSSSSSSGGGTRTLSLFTHEAPVSAEEWEELQGEVAALGERLAAAERESKAVMEENARLRLDNTVEQSNLKSLTKAKNEEIKRLTAEVDELKKQQQPKEGGGGDAAECQKKRQELEGTVQQLQKQVEEAAAAKAKAAAAGQGKAAAAGDGAGGAVRGKGDDDDDDGQLLKEFQEEEGEEEKKGGGGAASVKGKGKAVASSFLSKQLISVPEPQPLNGHWEPLVKELFELVRA